ncbi:MAG: DUF4126 domain-containing protein [Acidimicrobiia bacterium]|nr:DUF4126 domain-containing protein [Acidimicrobiia bacterium]MBT8248747.1 DUF4126 domain-containing protein [Acidimicrobiia bacterium]NND12448.1 DUF4126 domain-containing protein [Acidimicrobiia bacterium]NNL26921.1 DUF4126 domain-containing protein [Acidimicrobiia bacterium]NNL47959.1 DUF4126 domain-containing protein [Acidimicrobiia bacterium]
MELLTGLFSAFGLSVSAGLNAYIPLLVVGLMDRFTSLLELSNPYDIVSNPAVLIALGALTVVEIVADKVPAVNHINDAIQTFVRPTAGALVFAASTSAAELNPAVAVIAGLLVSGGVHATKSTVVRPAVTATTAGIGNTPVSAAEDVVATVTSVLAVVAPILVAILLLAFSYLIWRWVRRLTRRKREPTIT